MVPVKHELVLVLDFGGQYNQLIARRVRECGVYCEVKPYTTPLEELRAMAPIGIIFTGGPNSVYLDTAPHVDPEIFTWGVPILGICFGCQLMAHSLGGEVSPAREGAARAPASPRGPTRGGTGGAAPGWRGCTPYLFQGGGGGLDYHNGSLQGGTRQLERSLRRADIILCPVNCNSHGACIKVKNLAKKHNKTFYMLPNGSLSTISRLLGSESARQEGERA